MHKYGFVNGVQRYKCINCGKQFIGGERINNAQLWEEYVKGKQTYSQLSNRYNCSIKTIQRRIDKHKITLNKPKSRAVIVLMDTTYWGKTFGVMLFKDNITKENLLKYYVKYETNGLYKQGIGELEEQGFLVQAIVCDGRKGLIKSFNGKPVQMCQFHQSEIIRRYLTKKPKLKVSIELMEVATLLTVTDKESFIGALNLWAEKWEHFLNERTINQVTMKSSYTHKRLRSAHHSLINNLPWLFTWYDNMDLDIPNTTNAIDGHFSDLKNKLRNHNGLSLKRKMKFIDEFLKV